MEQLDQQVVNLTKAIRQIEGGVNAGAGASGEIGAYQFTPETWERYSKETGVNVPLEQANLQQRNEVAYKKIKAWKDQGYNVGQIASMWNAGEGNPDAYKQDFRGVNSMGVSYDTPAYAEKVATIYQQLKGQNIQQPQGYQTTPAPSVNVNNQPVVSGEGSYLQQLENVGKERVNQISTAIQKGISGEYNPASSVLQTAGAIAGGVGDVLNTTLENIPVVGKVVKGIENILGMGVGTLANTSVGQSVVNSVSQWAKEHPELAGDIGATFNLATVIPIFRGLTAIKGAAMDATAQALKGAAEKGVAKDLTKVALKGSYKSTSSLLERDSNVFKNMATEKVIPTEKGGINIQRTLPDIDNGKYNIVDATSKSWENINNLNREVDAQLSKQPIKLFSSDTITKNALKSDVLANSGLSAEELINTAKALDPLNKTLWDKFEIGTASLQEINQLRSSLAHASRTFFTDAYDTTVKKKIGGVLSDAMGNFVKKEVPQTKNLFSEMTKQFRIQDALDILNGRNVKTGVGGLLRNLVRTGATAAGGAAGIPLGNPALGAMVGYILSGGVSKLAEKAVPQSFKRSLLERTGINAVKTKNVKGKIGGLLGASLLQKESK